ncbi:hypothetical protein C8R44DRAFT_988690 [Mycena epipterygia]|nr:hypothetical protein C8R44DRAFT_988690 [Mycena epipterygia]
MRSSRSTPSAILDGDNNAEHDELHDQHDDQHTEHDATAQPHLRARLRQRRLRSLDWSRVRGAPVSASARGRMKGGGGCEEVGEDWERGWQGRGEWEGRWRARFAAGLEWEIPNADVVVLLGLTHALSYQALPHRLPPRPRAPLRFRYCYVPFAHLRTSTSVSGLSVVGLSISSSSGSSSPAYASTNVSAATLAAPAPVASRSIFGRRGASASSSSASLAPSPAQEAERHEKVRSAESAVEEMIAVGTAFDSS